MVFPVSDDNTDRIRTPYVTIAFIVINVLVFFLLQQGGTTQRTPTSNLTPAWAEFDLPPVL